MPCTRPVEQGAALIIVLSVLAMAGLSFALDALLIKSTRVRDDQRAAKALALAKEALLAYAVAQDWDNNKGRFPCPDLGNVSNYDTSGTSGACGGDGLVSFGLLPWKSLGLPNLRDGDNAPILYAVSGRYKMGSTLAVTGYPTSDLLTFNNITNNNTHDYVAIVFAPGERLPTQTRVLTDTAANQRSQFLEKRYVPAVNTDFEAAQINRSAGYNDRVIGITHNELIAATM
ncbi:MAG: hypothetical protein HQL64_05640 [Magnetococcales bacterium]|nr:hypothetical protein [Magnetococcales bacterium]